MLRNGVSRLETDTKLDISVPELRACNGTKVIDHVGLGHTNTSIWMVRSMFRDDLDVGLLFVLEGKVSKRCIANFVKGLSCWTSTPIGRFHC
jgi:hypothetical protein